MRIVAEYDESPFSRAKTNAWLNTLEEVIFIGSYIFSFSRIYSVDIFYFIPLQIGAKKVLDDLAAL